MIDFIWKESLSKGRFDLVKVDSRQNWNKSNWDLCDFCQTELDETLQRLREETRDAKDGDFALSDALRKQRGVRGDIHFHRHAWKESRKEKERLSAAARKHKRLLGDRQGWLCPYCGRDVSGKDVQVDHRDPEGTSEPNNLDLLCRSCNNSKHSRTPEEYQKWLAAEYRAQKGILDAVGKSQGWFCSFCERSVGKRSGYAVRKFAVSWEKEGKWLYKRYLSNSLIVCRDCADARTDAWGVLTPQARKLLLG